jgi:hypothetical protein
VLQICDDWIYYFDWNAIDSVSRGAQNERSNKDVFDYKNSLQFNSTSINKSNLELVGDYSPEEVTWRLWRKKYSGCKRYVFLG